MFNRGVGVGRHRHLPASVTGKWFVNRVVTVALVFLVCCRGHVLKAWQMNRCIAPQRCLCREPIQWPFPDLRWSRRCSMIIRFGILLSKAGWPRRSVRVVRSPLMRCCELFH